MKTILNLSVLFLILTVPHCQDAAVNDEIKSQLEQDIPSLLLTYPKSVKRFYKTQQFQSVWIKEATPSKTWQSMLLLDCVLQFGLSHADYHPKDLDYAKLKEIMKNPNNAETKEKVKFELLLTDALITFINDLHFGKLNPIYSRTIIDDGNLESLSAEKVLINALSTKDFMAVLLSVQPKTKQYAELQKYMTSIRGQNLNECYVVPETEARKVSINMERLKWNSTTAKTFIEINIPAYTLTYNLPDTSFTFKLTVGKPASETPVLVSTINYLSTAPDWKVPVAMVKDEILPKAIADINYLENQHYTIYDTNGKLLDVDRNLLDQIKKNPAKFTIRHSAGCELTFGNIVFHFPNPYGIYLYDEQKKPFFDADNRAVSNSCIGLQDAKKLASLILKYDGETSNISEMLKAADSYKCKNFILKTPVPLYITYQTCAVKDGRLITYPDIYNKDQLLEKKLYNNDIMLVNN